MDKERIEEILGKIGSQGCGQEVYDAAVAEEMRFVEGLKKSKASGKGKSFLLSSYFKMSAAAVILIAAMVLIPNFNRNATAIVLETVLDNIGEVKAFEYRMEVEVSGDVVNGIAAGLSKSVGVVTVSDEYGIRIDMVTSMMPAGRVHKQIYVLSGERKVYVVMPDSKQYVEMDMTEGWSKWIKRQSRDPREMIAKILSCKHKKLTSRELGGVVVDGYQTRDLKYAGGSVDDVNVLMWVDSKNLMPVYSEFENKYTGKYGVKGRLYDFDWDRRVDANSFVPVIGEGFERVADGGMAMGGINEAQALKGLGLFCDVVGRYPSRLNMFSLIDDFVPDPKGGEGSAAYEIERELAGLDSSGRAARMMELMQPVQSLAMFNLELFEEGLEPEYFGGGVDCGDGSKVLMRWRSGDDGYRVIFGDLRIEAIKSYDLGQLEGRAEAAAEKKEENPGRKTVIPDFLK